MLKSENMGKEKKYSNSWKPPFKAYSPSEVDTDPKRELRKFNKGKLMEVPPWGDEIDLDEEDEHYKIKNSTNVDEPNIVPYGKQNLGMNNDEEGFVI